MNDILAVENLSKIFMMHILNGKVIRGCEDISFTLPEGESIGILGPSGTGKSSILKCIYRTYIPTEGRIVYHSLQFGTVDLASAPENIILALRNTEIGYVSQFLKIMPRVSALDVVAEGLIKRGTEKQEARYRAREHLTRLQISPDLWDAYPSTFSGGEQQRINIARAAIVKPRLMLLDEPTASLDGRTREAVIDLLLELKREGTSIIGIFHDLDTMFQLVDKTYDMSVFDSYKAEV
ncbi:MAG: phosphonate C-P lyase system protein PhnL [Candidatus Aquicultor sp.]|nr:phosphonate C-P lyase system protein PhnL [Candidatus Aquicultor sp.]